MAGSGRRQRTTSSLHTNSSTRTTSSLRTSHNTDARNYGSIGKQPPSHPERRVDFVLVYETAGKDCQPTAPSDKRLLKHQTYRSHFIHNLRTAGLHIDQEVVESGTGRLVHFVKLHATWPVLCHFAEHLNMRAPLQAHANPSVNWSEVLLSRLRLPNLMAQDVPSKPLDFYTCPFRKSKIDRFVGCENRETFFSNTQRSRIVYEILSTSLFGKKKKGEVGIDRLVEDRVFTAAFPLHEGRYESKDRGWGLTPRQVLYRYWARWGVWYKYQPLDHIREYFGEKIAIYFAWLGFYTGWLLPAAVLGLLVFLYGVATMHKNRLALEVCGSRGSFTMCPLCDEMSGCKQWDLSEICIYVKLAYLFDHPGTVFYAVFVSFWAVTFLEYWKRKSVSLAHHWDCIGFQDEEERPRPEFAARAPFLERNPVTGVPEPSFPRSQRNKRIAAGLGIVFLMISLVLIFIVAVIIYRVLISIPLFQIETFKSQAQAIANVSGAVVNLIIIMLMSRVYERLAYRLTSWEMHRTQTEFDDNLTFKVFIFQFVNFYSSIFYIAFFKGRFVGFPHDNYTTILGLRNEDCSAGGCLIELAQQLAVIMIGKQIINNAQEILLPKMKAWWHNRRVKLPRSGHSQWEEDYQLVDNEGLFEEYLEMVLQFGFITIFVAAFPLAPLFALLNNWVEIRLDAQKLVCETRRIVAERAENIGIWFKILDMLAHLAVISNGFLIAFTSEFLPKLLYQYEYNWELEGYINFTLAYSAGGKEGSARGQCRYRGLRDPQGRHTPFFWRLLALQLAFVILFEHVVFGVCRLIDILVPDIPESLELKIKRERYLAKQALQDSDTILQVAAGVEDKEEKSSNMVLDLTAGLARPSDSCSGSSQQTQSCPLSEASVGTISTTIQPSLDLTAGLVKPSFSHSGSSQQAHSCSPSLPSDVKMARTSSIKPHLLNLTEDPTKTSHTDTEVCQQAQSPMPFPTEVSTRQATPSQRSVDLEEGATRSSDTVTGASEKPHSCASSPQTDLSHVSAVQSSKQPKNLTICLSKSLPSHMISTTTQALSSFKLSAAASKTPSPHLRHTISLLLEHSQVLIEERGWHKSSDKVLHQAQNDAEVLLSPGQVPHQPLKMVMADDLPHPVVKNGQCSYSSDLPERQKSNGFVPQQSDNLAVVPMVTNKYDTVSKKPYNIGKVAGSSDHGVNNGQCSYTSGLLERPKSLGLVPLKCDSFATVSSVPKSSDRVPYQPHNPTPAGPSKCPGVLRGLHCIPTSVPKRPLSLGCVPHNSDDFSVLSRAVNPPNTFSQQAHNLCTGVGLSNLPNEVHSKCISIGGPEESMSSERGLPSDNLAAAPTIPIPPHSNLHKTHYLATDVGLANCSSVVSVEHVIPKSVLDESECDSSVQQQTGLTAVSRLSYNSRTVPQQLHDNTAVPVIPNRSCPSSSAPQRPQQLIAAPRVPNRPGRVSKQPQSRTEVANYSETVSRQPDVPTRVARMSNSVDAVAGYHENVSTEGGLANIADDVPTRPRSCTVLVQGDNGHAVAPISRSGCSAAEPGEHGGAGLDNSSGVVRGTSNSTNNLPRRPQVPPRKLNSLRS